MITFVFKSVICLTLLFGFYHLFLRNTKVFNFNRFYLLFSLVFALIIPFITIRINLNLPINSNLQGLSNVTDILIKGEETNAGPINAFSFQELLIVIYFIVSSILLLRFTFNIYKIIKLIRTCPKVKNFDNQIILVENKILPYSFFRYIFIYRSDYEKGRIKKELLIHEQVHCLEYHSVDILIIELVNIFLWFNPFLRLFRKAIQLNHEFLADNKVLSSCELSEYQNTLLNLVFRNNSTYLASNFNYSLTKKRLIMMTKNNSSGKAIIRKIAAFHLFLILAITLTFGQEIKQHNDLMNFQNEWWYPILKKLNIEPSGFNNFDGIFEMGSKNVINNGIVTLEDAFFLIKKDYGYIIIKSPLAYHDTETNTIKAAQGTIEYYYDDSKNNLPRNTMSLKVFEIQIKGGGGDYFKAEEMISNSL